MNSKAYCLTTVGFLYLHPQHETLQMTENKKHPVWWVDINKVRTDYPVIENLKQWLVGEVPLIHPEHPEYAKFWSRETKKCIEGVWGKEWGKYRYMPGSMYYYINYGVMQHSWKEKGIPKTKFVKPIAADFLWENRYLSWCCYGFSGFEKDSITNCHRLLKEFYDGHITKSELPLECLYNGEPKKYEDAFLYIKRLHNKNLGKSLFGNVPSNKNTLGTRGGGKALKHGSKVYQEDGIKNIEEVVVGDRIFGADGKLTTVTNVYPQGIVPVYRLTFRSGRTVECCENHLWEVTSWDTPSSKILSTKELLLDYSKSRIRTDNNTKGVEYKYKVKNNKPIIYSKKEFKIDPYLVGLLLGDGHISHKYTNRLINITCNVIDLQHYLDRIILPQDVSYRLHQKKGTDNYTVFFGHKMKEALRRSKNKTHLYDDLITLGIAGKYSYEKEIPEEYFYGDVDERYRILQGLLDSDGTVSIRGNVGTVYFDSTSKKLADGVCRLCRSLGISCDEPKFSKNNYRGCYSVCIHADSPEVFSLKRKKDLVRPRITNYQRTKIDKDFIINIEKVEDAEATCITVDNEDRLFLTDNFVVTHNSYEVAIAELEFNYVFSGSRRFDEDFIEGKQNCFQVIGAGDTSKSADCLAKFKKSQDSKADAKDKDFVKWFGIWEEFDNEGNSIITPCPFYKRSTGSLESNNKQKPYTSKYKVEQNGEWKYKGSDNRVYHVNYSTKKGDGSQAAVGERYLYSDVEEQGLVENVVEIHGSNEPATKRGAKFGIQDYQGTSGNIEYIQSAKKMWLNPRDYFFYPLRNEFTTEGANGEAGVFLPRYMVNFDYKDENGNTDYVKAIAAINKEREQAALSKDPRVLHDLLMNEPCYPYEMWQSQKGYYLPYEEASVRHRELTLHQHYKDLMTPVELIWNKSISCGVEYKIVKDIVEPITEYPLPKNLKDPSGCVVIYEFPQTINGVIPQDMYCFIGHDPYVEEAIDRGGSLGVTYILKNPKYIPFGYTGNIIVASYIGKPVKGIEYYYEQQEKLIQFYGNPQQGLWYEKNRGENVRAYYTAKNKLQILAPTPQYQQGSSMFQRHIQSFGYLVSSNKRILINMLKDWLLEETEFMLNGQSEKALNIQRIPCLFLINQIMQYNEEPGANFDAVMGMLGCILGLRECQSRQSQEQNNKPQVNRFKSILENHHIFKNNDKIISRTKRRQVV